MVKTLNRIDFVVCKNLTEADEKTGPTDTSFLTMFGTPSMHISGADCLPLAQYSFYQVNPWQNFNFSPTGQVIQIRSLVSISRFPCNPPVNPDIIKPSVLGGGAA